MSRPTLAWVSWRDELGRVATWTQEHPSSLAAVRWVGEQLAAGGDEIIDFAVGGRRPALVVERPVLGVDGALVRAAAGRLADAARTLEALGTPRSAASVADLIPSLARALAAAGLPTVELVELVHPSHQESA